MARLMRNPPLTQERLKEVLSYDPLSGIFIWKKITSVRVKIGQIAGANNSKGYIVINIDGQSYLAHRLAWFYEYGVWPNQYLDHIDGIKHHNAIANLREATNAQNLQYRGIPANNTSGYKGVYWSNKDKVWRAQITAYGVLKALDSFKTAYDASLAYQAAAERLHGEFAKVA